MIKLLKYELLRKKKLYIICLCIFAVLTLLAAIGIPRLEYNTWIILVFISTIIVFVGGALLPFIINTVNYYGDYKNRSGYMMFLTPSSGYKIFGSKILTAVIDTLGAFILMGLFAFISYSVLDANFALHPQISSILSEISAQLPGFNIGTIIFIFCAAAFIQGIGNIVLALFSITVSKTLLSHRSINWFIPLIVFIALSWVQQFVATLITAATNFNSVVEMFSTNNLTLDLALVMGIVMGMSVIFMAIYTIVGSTLINKKLDL